MTKDKFDDIFGKHFGQQPNPSDHHYRQYHGKMGSLEHFTYLTQKLHHHMRGWLAADDAKDIKMRDFHSDHWDTTTAELHDVFLDHLPNGGDQAYADLQTLQSKHYTDL